MFVDQNLNVIAQFVAGVRIDYGIFRAAHLYECNLIGIYDSINGRMGVVRNL